MTKQCTNCNVDKDVTEFHIKSSENRRNSWCKQCVYERQRRRWIDRKIKAVRLMGGQCSICGYNKNLGAFDFHHKEPSDKEFSWTVMRLLPWNRLINELKKCSLLCRNCHAELHYPHLSMTEIQFGDVDNRILNTGRVSENLISTGKCPVCKDDVYGTKYCSQKCSSFASRRTKRPRKATLQKKLTTMSWSAIGREYRVSDNAVRKWARAYGISK